MLNSLRRCRDALACIVLALLALPIAAAAGALPTALTTLVGAPLALLAPGYALVLALFPRRGDLRMRESTRLMFAIGMSVVCNVLLTLLLNFTPWGIRTASLTTGMALLTIALALIAIRRTLAPDDIAPTADPFVMPRLSSLQASISALSAVIVAAAVLLSINEAQRVQTLNVVQLWMVPLAKTATASATVEDSVRVGIRNVNADVERYTIELQRGGYTVERYDDVFAAPGQSWEMTLTLRADTPGSGPVTALLFDQADRAQPIRRTQYWLAGDPARPVSP
jgi:uncharacterized membrane protein